MDMQEKEPAIRNHTGRNPDGTFVKGFSGNYSGRPKGTMKDYLRRKFIEMSDEEKENFLKNVSPEMQIRLAEGNPENTSDIKVEGEMKSSLTSEMLAIAEEELKRRKTDDQ